MQSDLVPWERYIRHGPDVNEENAQRLLFDFLDVLEEHNITNWLNWGLLLGAVRENNFIRWDTDMDVTSHWADREKVIKVIEPIMLNKGCYIPTSEECFPEDRFYIRDLEKIEYNFVEDCGDKYIYSKNRSPIGCPKHHIDKLDVMTFRGRKVFIPSDVESYLEMSYGNWRVPQVGAKPARLYV